MTDDGSDAVGPSRPAPSGVICVVLAAGSSTRMGGPNKLLERVDDVPMVATVVRAALASRADVGAKVLMSRHPTKVREVPVDAPGILTDVDTPEALRELTAPNERSRRPLNPTPTAPDHD